MIVLKPQDILVLLKTVSVGNREWTYAALSGELFMSASEVHASLKRATASRLWDPLAKRAFPAALMEFVVHGLKYAFPPEPGAMTPGIPTAHAAPPLNKIIRQSGEPPYVWPDPLGSVRGCALPPLYRSVPKAAKKDETLYQLLALVDSLRIGNLRERKIAQEEFERILKHDGR